MSRPGYPVSILVSLFALCLLLSCGSDQPATFVSETPVRDLFYASKDGEIDNYLAQQAFVERCMKAQGWEYVPEPVSVSGIDDGFRTLEDQRSLDYRQSYGLAYSPSQAPAEGELIYTENTEIYAGLSERERELWIAQQDECFAEAENSTGNVLFIETLAPALQEEILSVSALTHPDLQGEVARWSECMILRGFDLQHPVEAYQYAFDLYDNDGYDPESGVLPEDVAVAEADYECSLQLWQAVDDLIAGLEQQARD